MKEIAISKFKATCLAVLERVRATNQPIRRHPFRQTRRRHYAPSEVEKPQPPLRHRPRAVILGDIVGPAVDLSDWEAESRTRSA